MTAENRIAHLSLLDPTRGSDMVTLALTEEVLAVAVLAFANPMVHRYTRFNPDTALYFSAVTDTSDSDGLILGIEEIPSGIVSIAEEFNRDVYEWLDALDGFNTVPVERSCSLSSHATGALGQVHGIMLPFGRIVAPEDHEMQRIQSAGMQVNVGTLLDAHVQTKFANHSDSN